MRSAIFIYFLLGFWAPMESYSQTITLKDLNGIWDKVDTTRGKLSIQFGDDSSLTIQTADTPVTRGTYTLHSNKDSTILHIELQAPGFKHYDEYSLELVNPNTIRLENLDIYNRVFVLDPPDGGTVGSRRRSFNNVYLFRSTNRDFIIVKRKMSVK
jgi:hypothetical protein